VLLKFCYADEPKREKKKGKKIKEKAVFEQALQGMQGGTE